MPGRGQHHFGRAVGRRQAQDMGPWSPGFVDHVRHSLQTDRRCCLSMLLLLPAPVPSGALRQHWPRLGPGRGPVVPQVEPRLAAGS